MEQHAIEIDGAHITVTCDYRDGEGRQHYTYNIKTPAFHHVGRDLSSGAMGGDARDGMESLLCFLSACAEARRYERTEQRETENSSLFPAHVGEWAEQYSDEIEMTLWELENA
jgi:hypothetical protein